ncbi:hypothetical protein GCM10028895_46260 [Pontibacter rugosus]
MLTGCGHEEDYISKYCPGSCTTIKGRVSTDNGKTPVIGATLLVTWTKATYPLGGSTRKKAVATTDTNGNYELRFLLRDDELQDGYIDLTADFLDSDYLSCQTESFWYASELTRDTVIVQNYTVAPRATINFQLTQRADSQPTDTYQAIFKYKLDAADTDSCTAIVDPLSPYRTDKIPVPANVPVVVHLIKTRAGVRTVEKEVLTLQPDEVRLYEKSF